jgi:hypothetical protein
MPWYQYVAYFFGGAFLANAVPHFSNGISGRSFPSPFAKPPGKGLSSPTVNVFWAAFNAVVGYLLVFHVGYFAVHDVVNVVIVGAGALFMGVMLSQAFGQIFSPKK